MRETVMLTQADANVFLAMPKKVLDRPPLRFPALGSAAVFRLKSADGKESFLVDVNRKGQMKTSKCTYQERYAIIEVLLRLDIDGPPHENPDGQVIPCPHLHTYREGYGTKWAEPLPTEFTNPADLVLTLRQFLKFCNVDPVPAEIQRNLT